MSLGGLKYGYIICRQQLAFQWKVAYSELDCKIWHWQNLSICIFVDVIFLIVTFPHTSVLSVSFVFSEYQTVRELLQDKIMNGWSVTHGSNQSLVLPQKHRSWLPQHVFEAMPLPPPQFWIDVPYKLYVVTPNYIFSLKKYDFALNPKCNSLRKPKKFIYLLSFQ